MSYLRHLMRFLQSLQGERKWGQNKIGTFSRNDVLTLMCKITGRVNINRESNQKYMQREGVLIKGGIRLKNF